MVRKISLPLAAATISALDEGEQGVASGMNNAMSQLAGLLGVVILPALASAIPPLPWATVARSARRH